MKQSKAGRVWAALFLGMMFGLFQHFRQMRVLALGRDGFLAEQTKYFDRITQLHSISLTLVACVIVGAIAAGFYELIAAAFTKVIPPSTVEE